MQAALTDRWKLYVPWVENWARTVKTKYLRLQLHIWSFTCVVMCKITKYMCSHSILMIEDDLFRAVVDRQRVAWLRTCDIIRRRYHEKVAAGSAAADTLKSVCWRTFVTDDLSTMHQTRLSYVQNEPIYSSSISSCKKIPDSTCWFMSIFICASVLWLFKYDVVLLSYMPNVKIPSLFKKYGSPCVSSDSYEAPLGHVCGYTQNVHIRTCKVVQLDMWHWASLI